MKVFSEDYFAALVGEAKCNPRLRKHQNIHENYGEPVQRLFNAINLGSYIPPHRHSGNGAAELLVAVRGLMALITFTDDGKVADVLKFGSEKFGGGIAAGAEVSSRTWHTVIALEHGSVLLEVKAGPFDPSRPKELAPWAPKEATREASKYLESLIQRISR